MKIGMHEVTTEEPRYFRLYDEDECDDRDGYPFAWHSVTGIPGEGVKDLVREFAGNRCVRCRHPYTKGAGEWSPCDRECTHLGPVRMHEVRNAAAEYRFHDLDLIGVEAGDTIMDEGPHGPLQRWDCEAHWRILTVHHLLTGPAGKRNLKWWNLVSLCQRCHLNVQRRVDMTRPWPWPHSVWFRPYAAGWYAWSYRGEDLTREATMARLDELLALELRAERLFP